MAAGAGEISHYEGEDVIITMELEDSGEVINWEARITNLSMSSGTGEVETVNTFGGKTISIQKPTGEYEVSFDYVTNDNRFAAANLNDGTTMVPVAGTEYRSGTEASKKRWRVVLWFLGNGAGKNSSGSVVVPKKVGELLRYMFKDCYTVTNEEEMAADEYLKGTITLKCSATDEDGYGNVFKEWTSAQGTTALTVLNTTAHKGLMTWNTTTPAWSAGTATTRYRVG